MREIITPLEKLDTISRIYGTDIYIKRDDLTGTCFGGNKERILEPILQDAISKGSTVIVTVGTVQSNHCRMAASLSNKYGLGTELILIGKENDPLTGNHLLCRILGATIHYVPVDNVEEKINNLIWTLKKKGEKPYFIEGGGHNVLGLQGYIEMANELKSQLLGVSSSNITLVLPTGTGTTQAGLIVGFSNEMYHIIKIIGISISRTSTRCKQEIIDLILKCKNEIDNNSIILYDEYIGDGYGKLTKDAKEAQILLARNEGIILDPIYNAKAFAGMLDLIKRGLISGPIVYLNTGGSPNIFM